ncbi:MAG TPA: PIG-L family deacetylase [Candidatus Acidoferrales bacterium]|nr:PIG-L family deacetylase [Candidatus Acidoferrales bacterium]
MAHILAIHAHPDDVEFLAGGTLARLADGGHEITVATFTPGDCGAHQLGAEEIAAVRRTEAARAASRIGARYVCLEMRDFAIFNDDPSRRRVTEALRQARAQIVLAASPVDYLCDHEIASALVRDACFGAPLPNYRTGSAPLDAIPHLYFMDPVEGRDRENHLVRPDFVVDVGEVFARKQEMLAEHASQREWLRKHHGVDEYLLEMERWTRERGVLAGVSHGEGFRQYLGHAYPRSPLLQSLLGAAIIDTRDR